MSKFFIALMLLISNITFAQEEMTLEEYNAKLSAAKEREEIALPKIASLKTNIAALKEEINSMQSRGRSVWRGVLDIVGASQGEYDEFVTHIEGLQSNIAGFESTHGSDLNSWQVALKDAGDQIAEVKSQKMAAIPRVERLINDLETSLNNSQESLTSAQSRASASDQNNTDTYASDESSPASENSSYASTEDSDSYASEEPSPTSENSSHASTEDSESYTSSGTFTVGEGNSLWRIARNANVLGNPMRWQEIYEANRDKIQNPNIIYPGMELTIPQ